VDRRKFLELLPVGVAVVQSSTRRTHAERPSNHPNFLVLIADDLTYRSINSRNNAEVHTPNFDRIAASGCTFTHAFHQGSWMTAVCVPSRTMLNTGVSCFRAKTTFKEELRVAADPLPTWGQTLGRAGYGTYICGKWHLSPTMLQRSFREMGAIGPDMFDSTPEGGAAYNRPSSGNTWQPDDKNLSGHWVHSNVWVNESPDRIEHSCSMYADQAVRHLKDKLSQRRDPFFMYVGFNSPHDPRQSPKEYLDRYPQDKISIPPNYLPEHPFEQGESHNRDETLAPFPRTEEAVRLHRREYYSLITYMDAQIGRILDALNESGRAANTYVILTADHGLAVGEHGLMGKQNLYDCSVRVPLLIAGPGVPRGRIVDQLVYQHSLFATTCELAGAPVPKSVEFPSLVPLLHAEATLHEAVFSYYMDYQRSVRTTRHKLIVYPQIDRLQLFDLENDPWETRNLSDEPELADVRSDLLKLLKAFQQQLGDSLDLKQH
jgi:arylsulfatase A-like enzyme